MAPLGVIFYRYELGGGGVWFVNDGRSARGT